MKFRRIILNLSAALLLALAVVPAVHSPAYAMTAEGGGAADPSGGSHSTDPSSNPAACPSGSGANDAKGQVLQGLGETGSSCDDSQVDSTFKTAITLLSMVVGILSVIVIIISGMKFILSGGDSNKVANAKSSLIYALVGLAIAALAQVLIHFVLYQTDQTQQPPTSQVYPAKHELALDSRLSL